MELSSTIKVAWLGVKEETSSKDGLTVATRRFAATLDPVGPPGERKTEIVLQNDKQACYIHVVRWEAVSPITAYPKMIVVKPGERNYRVLIQSRDKKLFQITRIECNVPSVQGRTSDTPAALIQTVVVDSQGALRPESRRGLITVFTDHPDQEKIDLPFVVLD